jgi:hypothetical protein
MNPETLQPLISWLKVAVFSTEGSGAMIGAFATLTLAGVAWFFSKSFDSYRSQLLSLIRTERLAAHNLRILTAAIQLLEDWLASLKQDAISAREYVVRFGHFNTDEEAYLEVRDLRLVRLMLETRVEGGAFNEDIEAFYSDYRQRFAQWRGEGSPGEGWPMQSLIDVLDELKKRLLGQVDSLVEAKVRAGQLGRIRKRSVWWVVDRIISQPVIFPGDEKEIIFKKKELRDRILDTRGELRK